MADNMTNVEIKRSGEILSIVVDMSKRFGPSKSGKTTIVASTNGNVSAPGTDGKVKIGLNVYESR